MGKEDFGGNGIFQPEQKKDMGKSLLPCLFLF
jgi:hypothetical protein